MAVCCYLQASSDDVIGSVTSRDIVHASYFRISESFPLHYNRVYWTNSIIRTRLHTIFGQTKVHSNRVNFVKGLHQNLAVKYGDEMRIFGISRGVFRT